MSEEQKKEVETETDALTRVSMKNPHHLKQWLEASGREFLIFRSEDLVDSLPWPDGVNMLMQLIAYYRIRRRVLPNGEHEVQSHPVTLEKMEVPLMKDDLPTLEEMDVLVRSMVGKILEINPEWKL